MFFKWLILDRISVAVAIFGQDSFLELPAVYPPIAASHPEALCQLLRSLLHPIKTLFLILWFSLCGNRADMESREQIIPDRYSNRSGLRGCRATAVKRTHDFISWSPRAYTGQDNPKVLKVCAIRISAISSLWLMERNILQKGDGWDSVREGYYYCIPVDELTMEAV